jgi:hypothetical protein
VLTFGVIAEGPTDQTVIENILLGYFQDQEDEPDVRYVQPPRPLTETPAGWGHVFKSLERKDYEGALQYNDYLVIHIDTDVQEEPGYGVPRREGGKPLSVPELVSRVIARLKRDIDAAFYQANSHRILFAIAVDSIECWLLPLLYGDPKAAKTTGCLESANRTLRKADRKALSAGEEKFIRAYEEASGGYRKRKTLMQLRNKNPSLGLFIQRLDGLQGRLIADHPAVSKEHRGAASANEKTPGKTDDS